MQPSTDSAEWHVANGQRLAAIELQKVKIRELEREAEHRELDDPVRQRELQRLAAIELQSEKSLAAAEQRLERRKAKDQVRAEQEAVRREKSRLDSLASVEQSRELWRLRDEKSRENKRLRDEAGIRAGGAYKQLLASQQATEPSAKKRLVGEEDRRSR